MWRVELWSCSRRRTRRQPIWRWRQSGNRRSGSPRWNNGSCHTLRAAESEFANGRYNSCANRCYYACFQAAIAALLAEGIRARGQWSHEFVQGQFVGVLINQRHLYETQLRRVLADNQHVREGLDHHVGHFRPLRITV